MVDEVEQEKLGYFKKRAVKKAIKVARKRLVQVENMVERGKRDKEDYVKAIIGLTDIFEITEHDKPVTEKSLRAKSVKELSDLMEMSLDELEQLI